MTGISPSTLDFQALFEAVPGLYLVLDPDLHIVALSDAYARATMTRREHIIGRYLFDVFPDNPDDSAATGVQSLTASLRQVLRQRRAHTMAVQKYDIRKPIERGGGFEERYWTPTNSPVFAPDGSVRYIIHRVEDVTDLVRLQAADDEHSRANEQLRTQAAEIETEIHGKVRELAEVNQHLKRVNQDITALYESLRDSEARQTFLLRLGDALRSQSDPVAIQEIAAQTLGEHLKADRVLYGELDAPNGEALLVHRDYRRSDLPSAAGRHTARDFGADVARAVRDGHSLVVPDVGAIPRLTADERAAHEALALRAYVVVPLVKDGRVVACLAVHQRTARAWTQAEVTIIRDVAERTWAAVEQARAEARSRAWEDRYLALFNSIDQGFCTLEVRFDERQKPVDYRFLEVSPSFERQTGIENGAGRWMRQIAPEQDEHWFEIYGRVALTGEPVRFEEYSTPLGRWWTVYAFRIQDPRLRRVAVLFNDVTDRKRAEEALREQENRLRLALTAGQMGTWDVDLHSGATTWDAKEFELLGLAAMNAPLPKTFYDLVHPDDRRRVEETVRHAMSVTGELEHEFRIVRSDGQVRWIIGRGMVLQDDLGRPSRMVGINYDITERKVTEERLRSFAQELELRVEERTADLIQSQARLRRLASDLNLAEQRERQRLAAELHDHLQQTLVFGKLKLGQGKRIAHEARACTELMQQVDDVLTEALTYTRTLVTELSPPVLRDHGLAAGLTWLGLYMKKYDMAVTVAVSEENLPPVAEDLTVLLFQSVRELLINAWKHADSRHASVRLERRDGWLSIEVRDEGKGFDVAATATGDMAGEWLSSKFGLFTIRERMAALGGSLEIQSAPGEGTRATLTLPMGGEADEMLSVTRDPSCLEGDPFCVEEGSETVREKGEASSEEEVSESGQASPVTHHASRSSKIRVLLVDDHIMVRQGLRSVLEGYPDVELIGEAGHGEEAVAMAEALRPDIVVMDINMPTMNGIDATVRIKAKHPDAHIIGLSVNAGGDNQTAMLKAGACTLLTKEAAVVHLYDAIQTAVKSR